MRFSVTLLGVRRRRNAYRFSLIHVIHLLFLLLQLLAMLCHALLIPKLRSSVSSHRGPPATTRTRTLVVLEAAARRNKDKRQQSKQDADDLNRWYESVDAAATPDDVFWQEMERQRLQNRLFGSTTTSSTDDNNNNNANANGDFSFGLSSSASTTYPASASSASSATGYLTSSPLGLGLSSSTPSSSSSSSRPSSLPQQQPQLTAEATLNEYAVYAVSDNWLDEELVWMMGTEDSGEDGGNTDPQGNLDQQLDEWQNDNDGEDGDDEQGDDSSDNAWMSSDEPWDHWGVSVQDRERDQGLKLSRAVAKEFLLEEGCEVDAENPEDESQKQEAEFRQRLSTITLTSQRLERARNSPKAKEYFGQGPDVVEGFDRCWVSAIDNACFKNLKGNLRNYGIQFLDNFGDWQDGSLDGGFKSIEEIASFKARKVFEVTGLPCIASRTSWEIEPIPNFNTGGGGGGGGGGGWGGRLAGPTTPTASPRVASGYRFNDVGLHVDYICDALRPLSEPSRVTQFKTCLCYYDGDVEVYDYGTAEVDLLFSNSVRTFIPVSQAINEMVKTLELTFGLEYQPWIKKRVDGSLDAVGLGAASVRLRDRVLKEGRVLPNEIIDVSAFMDSMVDVALMDECAKELSNRFLEYKPNKVITVATTGLVIALPIAKYLGIPMVYARKERNVVMSDTFKASYSSKTVGKNRELLVSRNHLDEDDRVLVVDDFLSSGSSQEALLRIVAESGAMAVGVGVLLEKVYESGRQSLSGFNVPIHSLCRVASLQNGVIQLVEEEGYDRMNKQKTSAGQPSQ